MWIDYPNQITESPEALLREEKRLKATPMADRVRFLRLLKSATYPTQTQVADLLGYDVRTPSVFIAPEKSHCHLIFPTKNRGIHCGVNANSMAVMSGGTLSAYAQKSRPISGSAFVMVPTKGFVCGLVLLGQIQQNGHCRAQDRQQNREEDADKPTKGFLHVIFNICNAPFNPIEALGVLFYNRFKPCQSFVGGLWFNDWDGHGIPF